MFFFKFTKNIQNIVLNYMTTFKSCTFYILYILKKLKIEFLN